MASRTEAAPSLRLRIQPRPSALLLLQQRLTTLHPADVTVAGTKFVAGIEVTLFNGSTTLTVAANPSTLTATKCVGTFNLSILPAGTYNVKVTNPGPGTPNATKTNGFTLRAPSTDPTITSFTPTSGPNTAPLSSFTVTGTYFRAGATITIANGSTTKTVAGTMSNGGTTLKGTLPLKDLPIGNYSR